MGINVIQTADGYRRMIDDATGNTVELADGTSRVVATKIASVARTDTAAKNLFTLPVGAIPIDVKIWTGTLSNAATTATVSVGKAGANTTFVNAFDVKGGTAKAQNRPASDNLFVAQSTSAETQVTGIYAETGTASTTGGPFWVVMDYYVP